MKAMKDQNFILLLFLCISALLASCDDDETENDNPMGAGAPEVLTIPASNIGQFRALGGGAITEEGNSELTSRGLLWSDSPGVSAENAMFVTNHGSNVGVFNGEIDRKDDMEIGLDSNTTYYFKAYAENAEGISYGEELNFTTMENFFMEGEPVSDIDGNTYRTVQYENEGMTWMAENLKTTRYRNGDSISYIADVAIWEERTEGAFCYYENDISYVDAYGALYNYYTVTDPRGLCPLGWHVPTSLEWYELEMHIEDFSTGSGAAGHQLKESGTEHWSDSGQNPTNFSGFSGRGAGFRAASIFGDFVDLKTETLFWSSTEFIDAGGNEGAYISGLHVASEGLYRASFHDRTAGMSIRCIKNE